MTTISKYQNLALGWSPESKTDHQFKLIAAVVIVFMLALGFVLSAIDLPEPERLARPAVPDRIAQFIVQKEKAKVIKPKPKPKPKPQPKPRIKKPKKKKPELQKPLTKSQKSARKKAESSGLLALSNELEGLMDTSAVTAAVGGKVSKKSSRSSTAATLDNKILTAGASAGSGGVNEGQYTASVSQTRLTDQERQQIKQTLLTKELGENAQSGKTSSSKGRSKSGNIRAEEDVTIVFDQNKSKLYSLYSRARRKNPGLKGKIVFEITISSSGTVTNISIQSSELNDPALEKSLLSRIKMFNFGVTTTETLTVTYPIEFLPS